MKDESKIYKLIGPVLVPQDRPEATSNVEKRLEFIQSEVKRVDDLINTSQKKLEEKRNEVSIQSSSNLHMLTTSTANSTTFFPARRSATIDYLVFHRLRSKAHRQKLLQSSHLVFPVGRKHVNGGGKPTKLSNTT